MMSSWWINRRREKRLGELFGCNSCVIEEDGWMSGGRRALGEQVGGQVSR